MNVEGNNLILRTNPQPRSQDGKIEDGKIAVSTMTWEKLK
jgi:hypothetical protein